MRLTPKIFVIGFLTAFGVYQPKAVWIHLAGREKLGAGEESFRYLAPPGQRICSILAHENGAFSFYSRASEGGGLTLLGSNSKNIKNVLKKFDFDPEEFLTGITVQEISTIDSTTGLLHPYPTFQNYAFVTNKRVLQTESSDVLVWLYQFQGAKGQSLIRKERWFNKQAPKGQEVYGFEIRTTRIPRSDKFVVGLSLSVRPHEESIVSPYARMLQEQEKKMKLLSDQKDAEISKLKSAVAQQTAAMQSMDACMKQIQAQLAQLRVVPSSGSSTVVPTPFSSVAPSGKSSPPP